MGLLHPPKSGAKKPQLLLNDTGPPPPLLGALNWMLLTPLLYGLSLPHSYLLNQSGWFAPVCLAPQPFLALSSDELSKTIPLLTEVPVGTLKVALPLLAKQNISVIQKMIKFLKLVSSQTIITPNTQHTLPCCVLVSLQPRYLQCWYLQPLMFPVLQAGIANR